MCRKYTKRRQYTSRATVRAFWVAAVLSTCALAQTSPVWKRVAGTYVDRGLAGPATGPVNSVWYGPGGNSLLAQTVSGRVFESTDFEHWKLSSSGAVPAQLTANGRRSYLAGPENVFASEDGGASWVNLTGYNNKSVIGGAFTSIAVAPSNPQEIAVANRFGVWRSVDGGMTWRGVNQDLPGLPVRRLADRRTVVLDDGSTLSPVAGMWSAAKASTDTKPPAALTQRLAATPEKLWVDAERSDVALAASGARLYRTVNGGLFWDEVTGSLPDARIHGIAADRSANVVYLATDRGVYSGSLSLNDAGPARPEWVSISRDLPAAAAWDVLLNNDNTLTVALDGYGVYETAAPHRTRNIRLVNGADLSDRAAAPGSLISILGAKVSKANGGYPILASSDQSSQLQVPFDAAAGRLALTLETSAGQWSAPLVIKNAAPAIFVDSEGAPLILDAASGLVMDSNIAVRASSTIQIMVTGLGKVTPEWPTGIAAPLENPPAVVAAVTAFLDGTPVKVTRSTLAPGYVGYYVVEMEIPAIVNRGASELRLVMNGEESNRVKLFLEPDLQ